jgi:alpha-L-fucosidase
MKRLFFIFITGFFELFSIGSAQETEANYVPVTDQQVANKLSQWQDSKLGLLMHWGTYSEWGIVESWSLCGEDEGWCERKGTHASNYDDYKKAYQGLKRIFNPTKFDPEKWANAAQQAGMRYVVFTTKHHDGFCMFDTKTTDYKITSNECPYHTDPRANITKAILDAFRNKGMMAGMYYSKPDWNCEYYWWPYFPTPDRHVNYNPAKHPERWKQFQDFTYHQIQELMTGYGPIDILWLDGAWVRPFNNMPKEFESWAKKDSFNQDINMTRIAAMARANQPGLIIVDRWVNGEFENYLTPENKVPEKAMSVPWESCIPMATSWSYVVNDKYKLTNELIHLLVEVVAKGGNLLLNIGPSPDGEWAPDAYDRLKKIGNWMAINKNAIYNTKPIAPYKSGNFCFTRNRTGTINAIFLAKDKDKMPPTITIPSFTPSPGSDVTLAGLKEPLRWKKTATGCVVTIPKSSQDKPPCKHAWVFQIHSIEK